MSFEAQTGVCGPFAVLSLRGRIDGEAEAALVAAYDRAASGNPPAILIDFSQVGFINSKGLALIVVLLRDATRRGIRLAACGLTQHYIEIFEVTRLTEHVDVYPDIERARGALMPAEGRSFSRTTSERQGV
jgi:anti-anti-sigma factor